jgi:hypothetical protein
VPVDMKLVVLILFMQKLWMINKYVLNKSAVVTMRCRWKTLVQFIPAVACLGYDMSFCSYKYAWNSIDWRFGGPGNERNETD